MVRNIVPARTTDYQVLVSALVNAFGDRLKLVILFGSQSRGEAHADSDHGIFVVVEGLPDDPLVRQRLVMTPLLPDLFRLPERLSLVAKTPDELLHHLTPLVIDIFVDGVSLYGQECFESLRRQIRQTLQDSGMTRRRIAGAWMWAFPALPEKEWAVTWDGYREQL